MHGATAPKTELEPNVAAWKDKLRKDTSTASGSQKKKSALQDDGDSGVDREEIEHRYGSLMRRLGRHPEIGQLKLSFLRDKLDLVRADLKTESKLSALPARLDEIDRQIDKLKGQKPLGKEGREAAMKWQLEVVAKYTNTFAGSCNNVIAEVTNLAKSQAKDLAKNAKGDKKKQLEDAAKASQLSLIENPIESLRVRFSKDLILEGPGNEQALAAKYDQELGSVKNQLIAFVNSVNFLGAVRSEVQQKADAAAKAKSAAESDKDAQALSAARQAAEASLAKLNDLGSVLAPGYAKDIQQATSAKQMEALDTKIKETIKAETEASEARASKYEDKADKLSKLLDKSMSGQNDAAKAALKALQAELDQTKSLAATGNPRAAEAAARIAAKIEAASKDAANKDSAFSKLFTRATELQKLLADETVTKFFAKQKEPLQKAMEALLKDADALDPAGSQKTLDLLDAKIVSLKNNAKAFSEWQTLIKGQVELCNKDLKDVMGGALAALVRSDTKVALLIKDIEKAYETPGVDQKAVDLMITDVKGRILKLRDLKNGKKKDELGTAIEAEQKEAKKDIAAKEKAEKEKADDLKRFKEEVAAFNKELQATAKKVEAANGSEEDVQAVEAIVSAAETMAKNGELKEAREKMKIASAKRKEMEEVPGGYSMRSVKELGDAAAKWKEAITNATGLVKEVAAEAEGLVKKANKKDKGIRKKIEEVCAIFNQPAMFDAPLKVITDKTATQEQRKAAREQILREIRELRAAMDANPILQLVRRNPFEKKQVTAKITEFLGSLELNTLRAIRPEK